MRYLGDFKAGQIVTCPFTTNNAAGAAVAPLSAFEAADLVIYKNNVATQRTSAAGITMTSPFDTVTGFHMVAIDLSDNTDASFWAAGNDYHVMLIPDTETVDSQTVVAHLFSFSIQNRGGIMNRQMTESYAADGVAPTPEQAIFLISQFLMDFGISGTTLTVKGLDGSTNKASFTLNSAANPSSITRTT